MRDRMLIGADITLLALEGSPDNAQAIADALNADDLAEAGRLALYEINRLLDEAEAEATMMNNERERENDR